MADFNQKIIVIDPGHGGSDFGYTGAYSFEKNINLLFAKSLYNRLILDFNFYPVLTRYIDSDMELSTRIKCAIDKQPHGFISFHNGSLSDTGSLCNQIFFYNENGSRSFASSVYSYTKHLYGINKNQASGVYFGRYNILKYLDSKISCPSILFKMGTLLRDDDEILLNDAEFVEKIVNSIYFGLREYYKIV